MKQKLGLLLGPLTFAALLWSNIPGLSSEATAVLASTAWVVIWWVTEAFPLAATSLLPLVLLPLSGGADISTVTPAYGDKMVFLYMGGFMIAIAIEKWGLHKRIALTIIMAVGTDAKKIVMGFIIATAFLSMWISNTATTLMMLTIGLALIAQLSQYSEKQMQINQENFAKALLLGIAYAASIGGLATLIGTPTNVVLTAMIRQIFGVEISFMLWMAFALPLVLVLLFICWWLLVSVSFPVKKFQIPGGKESLRAELANLGKMSFEEKTIAIVFGLTGLAWIFRTVLLVKFLPALDDTMIALIGALVLFVLPSKSSAGKSILDWESAVKLPWGIILLFGAGLSLAATFQSSGLALWIGQQLSQLQGIHFLVIVLVITLAVNFLTEVTSNVATASIIMPILASLALVIDVHPFSLMIAATMAASCAFMLPVATPPNAIVFGSGRMSMEDMLRAGFRLNIISSLLIVAMVYFLLPIIFDFDPSKFPEALTPAFD